MDTLCNYARFEETIKNSRFLSELIPCKSQSQAREIIKSQKSKYADSTHVVHAFIVGNNAEIMGMSDDGEPGGTAGRPVLDVLKGRKCTNCILTVTRWFGGTLLGTGGLVKAYSSGAKNVISIAESQNAFCRLVEKKTFCFTVDYNFHKSAKKLLEQFEIFDLQEDFSTEITIKAQICSEQFEIMSKRLLDASNGKIKLQEVL